MKVFVALTFAFIAGYLWSSGHPYSSVFFVFFAVSMTGFPSLISTAINTKVDIAVREFSTWSTGSKNAYRIVVGSVFFATMYLVFSVIDRFFGLERVGEYFGEELAGFFLILVVFWSAVAITIAAAFSIALALARYHDA